MSGHEALCWAIAFAIVVATIWVVVWSIIIYRNKIKSNKAFNEHFELWREVSAQLEKDKLEKEQI